MIDNQNTLQDYAALSLVVDKPNDQVAVCAVKVINGMPIGETLLETTVESFLKSDDSAKQIGNELRDFIGELPVVGANMEKQNKLMSKALGMGITESLELSDMFNAVAGDGADVSSIGKMYGAYLKLTGHNAAPSSGSPAKDCAYRIVEIYRYVMMNSGE